VPSYILPSCWPCTTTQRRAKKEKEINVPEKGVHTFFLTSEVDNKWMRLFFFLFVRGVVVVVAFVVAPLTLRERASVLATPVTQSIKSFRRWPHQKNKIGKHS
jgi:hypothetical protein